jgi:hypothetical protein
MNSENKLKITYEAHGETHTAELPVGTSLPRVIYATMLLLVAGGFSREGIADLFEDTEQSIWEWEV